MDVGSIVSDWWVPAAIVAGGVVVGFVLERIVLVWLRALLERTSMRTPGRIVGAVKGATTELVVMVALYASVPRMPIGSRAVETWRSVLFVLLVVVLTVLVARLAAGALRVFMERSDGALPSTSIFVNIIRLVVFVIGFLIVMDHFGISITPVLTALGVGGLAVALALQDTLSGLFSGLQILAARQIKPGDFIELSSGETGEIIDITWRNTIIQTLPNNEVIIPNSTMASSIVTNYATPRPELSVPVQGGVAYDSDLDHVARVALEVANEVVSEFEGEFPEWEPAIRFHTFGDSAIEFTVVLRTTEFSNQYELKSHFIMRLKARFDAEGIEIPFPQRVVHSVPTGE